jgi:hypothetical protein
VKPARRYKGLHRGEKHPRARLNNARVRYILRVARLKRSSKEWSKRVPWQYVANRLGVTPEACLMVASRRRWSHVRAPWEAE